VTDELLAETRKGRGRWSTSRPAAKLLVARPDRAEHDHVAVVGDNRKLVVFSLEELPVMARGQGVTLQRYRDGGLADVTTLRLDDGLSWEMGGESGRVRTEKEIHMWKVARGAAAGCRRRGFRATTSSDRGAGMEEPAPRNCDPWRIPSAGGRGTRHPCLTKRLAREDLG
jgi:topoisomerase-4 subunit A